MTYRLGVVWMALLPCVVATGLASDRSAQEARPAEGGRVIEERKGTHPGASDWLMPFEPRSEDLMRRYLAARGALSEAYEGGEGDAIAAKLYFRSFLALALEGELASLLWCLDPAQRDVWNEFPGSIGAARQAREGVWNGLLARMPEFEPVLLRERAMEWLAEESLLPSERAAGIANAFASHARGGVFLGWAKYAEACARAPWSGESREAVETALRLLEDGRLAGRTDERLARRVSDASFRLQYLSVGCKAPNFCSQDPRGNEICLEDLRGHVVLVRFWSFQQPHIAEILARDSARVRRYWDDPFQMVGVNSDADSRALTRRFEELEVSWPNAWEAGNQGSATAAWHIDRPTTILLDQNGIVRAVDPQPEALQKALEDLIREQRQQGRGPRHGFPEDDDRHQDVERDR